MELVRFRDGDGREWEVWEVGARATPADRPQPVLTPGPQRWLCFESGSERRRLAVYPPRWHMMTPHELGALCRAASPARAYPAPGSSLQPPRDRQAP